MTIPGMGDMPAYKPRIIGELELNLSDHWRARYTDADELPDNAPVLTFYAVVAKGDRGYVTRSKGAKSWDTVTGEIEPGLPVEAAAKAVITSQTGLTIGKMVVTGFLECTATRHNTDFEIGTVTVRPVFAAAATEVGDVPEGSDFERRRLPLNEYANAMRDRYHELHPYLLKALNRFIVMREKGELEE